VAILSLSEAKQSLNIDVPDFDDELADYIAAAQECVDFLCGPSEATTVTETIRNNGQQLLLRTAPVLSLTSVTGQQYGAYVVGNLFLRKEAGIVGVSYGKPLLYNDWYTVVYSAGRASTPASIKQGVKIILAHQWRTRRGGNLRPNLAGADDVSQVPGLGYAIPNRALQILDPYLRGPGIG